MTHELEKEHEARELADKQVDDVRREQHQFGLCIMSALRGVTLDFEAGKCDEVDAVRAMAADRIALRIEVERLTQALVKQSTADRQARREIERLEALLSQTVNERNEAWFQLEEAGIAIKNPTDSGVDNLGADL